MYRETRFDSETRGSQTRESRRRNNRRGKEQTRGSRRGKYQTRESQTRESRCEDATNARFETLVRIRARGKRGRGDKLRVTPT